MSEIRHRTVAANGIQVHLAESGADDAPLVLLCHGFPESWYSWRHQLPALAAAGYHAVAPDMRGYGQTDAPAEIERYTLLAPEIEATAPGICTVHFTSLKNCRENVAAVVRQLAQLQLTAQAGLAATPALSFLAAFQARPVLQIEQAQDFLASLPIETLSHLPR